MAILLADVVKEVVELLNVSTPDLAYGTLVTAGKFKTGELDQIILDADATVIRLFLQIKGHGRRAGFLAVATNVAHGDTLASMVGPVETVQVVISGGLRAGTHLVTPWPSGEPETQELRRENDNPQALKTLHPHCIIDGNVFYHNGEGIVLGGSSSTVWNVRYPQYAKTAACQAPDEFRRVVALLSLAATQPKDGVRTEAAGLFRSMADDEIKNLGVPNGIG